jgi:chromosome segregation ATPase
VDAQHKKILFSFGGGFILAVVALLAVYFGIIGPGNSAKVLRAERTVLALREQVSDIGADLLQVRTELEKNLGDLDRTNAELASSTAELFSLTRRFDEAQARARSYAISLEEYRRRNAESVARIGELEGELRSFTTGISSYFDVLRESLDRLSGIDGAFSSAAEGLREIIDIVEGNFLTSGDAAE